jgi:(S)-3,5-dihydroxyphenylglycine transaminase
VLDPRDAVEAVRIGADAVVVSNTRERAAYARNLRHLVAGLTRRFAGRPDVLWTVPAGGFFVVVTVPFAVDDALLDLSAREYGVLWTPMAHFYDDTAPVCALRLSVSAVTPEQIDVGLDRLAALVTDELLRGRS